MKKSFFLILLCLGVCAPAFAFSGNDLKRACDLDDGKFDPISTCSTYIIGAAGMISVVNAAANKSKDKALYVTCLPPEINYNQTVDIVKKFLEDRPDIRHEESSALIFMALQKSFPCKK